MDSEAYKTWMGTEALTPHNEKEAFLKDNCHTARGADLETQIHFSVLANEQVEGAALGMIQKQSEMWSGRLVQSSET